jgi:adenine-specific DNA-methyltransferase
VATGISKHEQLSKTAIVAQSAYGNEMPLPSDTEKVELTYPSKASKDKILKSVDRQLNLIAPDGTSKEITSISKNSFGLMDNFFGLHDLIDQGKKVQLFYLDPPYGTGMDFQSRDLQHAYDDKMGPAAYTEFMRRRLILMRECLSDDGSIYVHIGHQMVAHLKLIMDEVFGASNFQNLITRRKCSSKNFTRKQYANLNDFILFYSKTSTFIWNQPGIAPEQKWIEKEYQKIDQYGRRFKLVPVHAPGTRRGETGKEWRGMMPPPGKHWQYVPDKLDKFDADGDIHWSRNGNPRRKVYWTDSKKISLTDYWDNYRDAHHQSIKITGYPTEKNFEMIKMIVGASSNLGDLVVDPFCGSGTSIHAARDLGRSWIGFDASFTAAEATLRRMKHGVEAMGDYVNGKKNGGVVKNNITDLLISETEQGKPLNFVVDAALLDSNYAEIQELARI